MKVLSVRLDDQAFSQVERARLDAGLSRSDWLRTAVEQGVERASQPRPPDEMVTRFCTHPANKRLDDGLCVACGSAVGVVSV